MSAYILIAKVQSPVSYFDAEFLRKCISRCIVNTYSFIGIEFVQPVC